jgi:hypothetical protein
LFRVTFQFFQADTGYLKEKELRSCQTAAVEPASNVWASGSPKSNAPIAEASTTLMSISISPNEIRRFRSGLQPETIYLLESFLYADGRIFPDSPLNDSKKFTL